MFCVGSHKRAGNGFQCGCHGVGCTVSSYNTWELSSDTCISGLACLVSDLVSWYAIFSFAHYTLGNVLFCRCVYWKFWWRSPGQRTSSGFLWDWQRLSLYSVSMLKVITLGDSFAGSTQWDCKLTEFPEFSLSSLTVFMGFKSSWVALLFLGEGMGQVGNKGNVH